MFFNNAYFETAQIKLLYGLHMLWQKQPHKCLIVTGSRSADFVDSRTSGYTAMKSALEVAVKQCQYTAEYHLLNFKPGFTATNMTMQTDKPSGSVFAPRGKFVPEKMIDPDDLAELLDLVINNKKLRIKTLAVDPF